MFNYLLFADDTDIFSNDPLHLGRANLKKIEQWCLSNKQMSNYTKTFQVIFKSPNMKIINPDDYIFELGDRQLETTPCTKFLGINLDNNLIFKSHIVEVCRK